MTEPRKDLQDVNGEVEWHLDKRVPIALIMTIVFQSMAAVWWASSMQSRLDSLERIISAQSQNESRLARVEQLTSSQSQALNSIEDKLDRVIERSMDN